MATASKGAKRTIDFTGVESGGGRLVPEGEVELEVVSVEEKESKDKNPYWAWKWKVFDGEYKGSIVYDNTSLQPQALWRLKGLLEAMGIKVGDGKETLDISSFKKKRVMAEIGHETYQGKDKARIIGFIMPTLASATPGKFKKGDKVTFSFDGTDMAGVIQSCTASKAVVEVTVDDGQEEWELDVADLNAASKSKAGSAVDDDDIPF